MGGWDSTLVAVLCLAFFTTEHRVLPAATLIGS